ncbi:MAG: hypothetical protein ACYTE5_01610 [Planctomycetota bacterium]|jgi:hypothetical protein
MRSTIKTFVILTILAVLVLSVLSLGKYYNVRLGIASGDNGKLTLTVPGLTHQSACLSARGYQLDMYNTCLASFLFVVISWRALLIRHIRN